MPMPISPPSSSASVVARSGRATAADRPYPRASIAEASSSDRSSASVMTGRAISRNTWKPAARLAPQPPGRSHPLTALDELRGHAERHGDRHPDLVEGRGHRLEEPLRVGEHVGGPDAEEQDGEAQPVVERRQQALERHGAADADPRGRGGKGDLGQREQDVGAVLPVEQHAEQDSDPDHDQAQVPVHLEALRPGRVGATGGHDVGEHGGDQREQQRVGGATGGGRQTEGPEPPRARVQRPGEAHALSPGLAASVDASR